MADILIAKDSFWYDDDDGNTTMISKGATVRKGHPLTIGREVMFDEPKVDYEFDITQVRPTVKKVLSRPATSPKGV